MPMNKTHFITLAGSPAEEHYTFKEMVKASKLHPHLWDSDSLCEWQKKIYGLGFLGAVLGDNIYGWCVRNDSGLAGWQRMSPNFPSMFDAIKWGIEWAKVDPVKREFYAHKHDLTQKPVIIKR